MSRLAQVSGLKLTTLVGDAVKESRARKATQFIGSDSLNFYQSDSGNAYDWSGTLDPSPQAPGTGVHDFLVVATTNTTPVLLADLIVELYVGDSSNLYTINDCIDERLGGGVGFQVIRYEETININELNVARWGVLVTGDLATTIYVKFIVVANSVFTDWSNTI